jgi:hypothetical protein
MAIITRKQTIEKIEPPRLDKYIFKSFRNDEGYVIFTNLIAKRHEMEQLIYYLFKDEYQHFEKPMIIYVLNQVAFPYHLKSEFIQYDLLQPNQTYDVFIADSMIAGDFIALQAKPDFKLEDIIGQPDVPCQISLLVSSVFRERIRASHLAADPLELLLGGLGHARWHKW